MRNLKQSKLEIRKTENLNPFTKISKWMIKMTEKKIVIKFSERIGNPLTKNKFYQLRKKEENVKGSSSWILSKKLELSDRQL